MTAPTISRDYLTLQSAKDQLELAGTSFADADLADAIASACRDIDDRTHRRFYPDPDAEQVRYYSPLRPGGFEIDDLCELTTLEVGNGTAFSEWTENTDFVLEPLNAAADFRPWERVVVLRPSVAAWAPRSVRVTGRFGWDAIPARVVTATKILTARYLLRQRSAPLGVVTAGGMDGAVMMRVGRMDPDAELKGLIREDLIA